jgi:hypothetical protein
VANEKVRTQQAVIEALITKMIQAEHNLTAMQQDLASARQQAADVQKKCTLLEAINITLEQNMEAQLSLASQAEAAHKQQQDSSSARIADLEAELAREKAAAQEKEQHYVLHVATLKAELELVTQQQAMQAQASKQCEAAQACAGKQQLVCKQHSSLSEDLLDAPGTRPSSFEFLTLVSSDGDDADDECSCRSSVSSTPPLPVPGSQECSTSTAVRPGHQGSNGDSALPSPGHPGLSAFGGLTTEASDRYGITWPHPWPDRYVVPLNQHRVGYRGL